MNYYQQIKKYIIETAPGYEPVDKNKSYTGNMLQARSKLGFTRIFSPGAHIEGEVKIFDRRHKNQMFKRFRYFGPRGELLWGLLLFSFYKRMALNNLEREKIDQLFVDRNVYFRIENIDKKYKSIS